MAHFYGVYLLNSSEATAVDLLRFLVEPQDIRVSHITLRGPYPKKLAANWVDEQNENPRYDWHVRLTVPGRFLSNNQCTVFLGVDLETLRELWHKPDFPHGVPHLTMYDGRDSRLADQLFELLNCYRWNFRLPVSKLRLIQRKFSVDEVLLPSFVAFHAAFETLVGDASQIPLIRKHSGKERLLFAEKVLDSAFRSTGTAQTMRRA